MNDVAKLMTYTTLVDILEANRGVERDVTYVEGESNERRVAYKDVYLRALGILHHLQRVGARGGDKMIIFLNNNEQFLDGFWAAVCGGIVPVPLAVGISDEHRHKLLRVARKLDNPLLYTDAKTWARLRAKSASLNYSRNSRRGSFWSNRSRTSQRRENLRARHPPIWHSFNSRPDPRANRKA
jgi:acyl-CoA synthetase (AMP-forming)/AMP-acid ligase II